MLILLGILSQVIFTVLPPLPASPLNMSAVPCNSDGGFVISLPVAETNTDKKIVYGGGGGIKAFNTCAKKQISQSILQSLCGLIFSLCFALANMAHPLQIGSWVLPTSDSVARREKLPWDLEGGIEGPQMGVCQCLESKTRCSASLLGLFVKTGGSFALLESHSHF